MLFRWYLEFLRNSLIIAVHHSSAEPYCMLSPPLVSSKLATLKMLEKAAAGKGKLGCLK